MPFTQMPLRYERAASSPENPVGIELSAAAIAGTLACANIDADEGAAPGFGAIAPHWPSRRRLLNDAGLRWALSVSSASTTQRVPAPPGIDFRFFNAAPVEQQIDMLRPGVLIALENLPPEHPALETSPPAVRQQVFRVEAGTGRVSEVALRCDTLWIDSDRGVATLSFRGLTDVRSGSREAIGKIVVASAPKGKRIS